MTKASNEERMKRGGGRVGVGEVGGGDICSAVDGLDGRWNEGEGSEERLQEAIPLAFSSWGGGRGSRLKVTRDCALLKCKEGKC